MTSNLFLYLDESGDLGFDFDNKHPSSYFVITILAAKNFSVLKTAIRRTLNNKINHTKKKRVVNELKGSATTSDIKRYFYSLLRNYNDWFLHAIVLDKRYLIKKRPFITGKETIYNLLAKTILEEIETINHATVVHLYVDKSKNPKEIETFDAYIQSNLAKSFLGEKILNIEHLNSEKNAGLQAADMFCYGIARKYEHDDVSWYSLFMDRIKREVIYRP